MSGSKDRFAEFCREGYVPLSHQPWWLDAVCGGAAHWEVALYPARKGRVCGAWPYFRRRRWGLPVIQLPPLTAYAGPWLRYPEADWLAFEKKAITSLSAQLPRVAFVQQCCQPVLQNALPFLWEGFRQTTRYTYVLPDTGDLPGLYAHVKHSLRTELRKAERSTILDSAGAPEQVFRLNGLSFGRKGRQQPYSKQSFLRLHEALQEREQSLCLLALDRHSGRPAAGLYLVFDAQCAAVLLTGFDPAFGQQGALHGLYWAAIRFCSERGLRLDFEGSMEPGIGRVFRAFGARLQPYLYVWKAGNRLLDICIRR